MTRRLGTTTILAALAGVLVALALLAGATAPPARGAEQLLETLTVPADGTYVRSNTPLRQGATYRLVVTGYIYVRYSPPTVPSLRTEARDAEYCWGVTGYSFPGELCRETPPGPLPNEPLRLGVGNTRDTTLTGLAGRRLPYRPHDEDPSHRYEVTFVAPADGVIRAHSSAVSEDQTGTSGEFKIQLFGEDAPPGPAVPPPATPVPQGTAPSSKVAKNWGATYKAAVPSGSSLIVGSQCPAQRDGLAGRHRGLWAHRASAPDPPPPGPPRAGGCPSAARPARARKPG